MTVWGRLNRRRDAVCRTWYLSSCDTACVYNDEGVVEPLRDQSSACPCARIGTRDTLHTVAFHIWVRCLTVDSLHRAQGIKCATIGRILRHYRICETVHIFERGPDALFASPTLLQPPENRKCDSTEKSCQLVSNIASFLPDEPCDRSCVPGSLHSQSSTEETKHESRNSPPAERE
jgi:hypothetical protein